MTKGYNYVIIDDDDFARETLRDLLDGFPQFKLLKSISESGMAIKHLATLRPDIVFLDINMPEKTGMDVQKEIHDLQLKSKVIFTTSHREFVVEAFKNQAFDYLVKPVSKSDLYETLNRFFKQETQTGTQIENKTQSGQTGQDRQIVIKNAFGTLILRCDDIAYISADGGYTSIYLINGKTEVISKNIGKTEHLFSREQFYKISRSHLINLKYLIKTDRLNKKLILQFNNQTVQLKASRELFYDLEKRLGEIKSE